MRLEGAIGKTLTGLGLAAVLCLNAAHNHRRRKVCPGRNRFRSPPRPSPTPPALGGMAGYEGLIVQKIDFPDLPSANTTRLLELIPQKVGSPLEREQIRESIQALHATGRFADIQAEAERTPDGRVELMFRMRANFYVGEIFRDWGTESSGGQPGGQRLQASVGGTIHAGEDGARSGQHQTTDGAERLLPVPHQRRAAAPGRDPADECRVPTSRPDPMPE